MNRWNGKKGSFLLLKGIEVLSLLLNNEERCALDKEEQAPIFHMFEMCSQLRCLLTKFPSQENLCSL